jgi:threonyl-tRNA synthetase
MNDELVAYAEDVASRLREAGLRVEVDARTEKVGRKVRDAEVDKVPLMLVVGRREAEAGQVAVRRHGAGDQGAMSVEEFIHATLREVQGLGMSQGD